MDLWTESHYLHYPQRGGVYGVLNRFVGVGLGGELGEGWLDTTERTSNGEVAYADFGALYQYMTAYSWPTEPLPKKINVYGEWLMVNGKWLMLL